MAVKIKFATPVKAPHQNLGLRILMIGGIVVAACFLVFAAIFGFYYVRYQSIVDQRLSKPLFADTAKIYAAPAELRPGQKYTSGYIAQQLRAAGYSVEGQGKASPIGVYTEGPDSITVRPGSQSYHAPDPATITFADGKITQIAGDTGQQLAAYQLEPLLITDLSDKDRSKRRLVTYDELPRYLVPAVTSIEDRHFFQHGGIDYWRVLGSLRNDLSPGHRYVEGGSTLTMQLAKMFFLTPERTFKRKFLQVVITLQLEHRYSKQKIFEIYANQVPLGQRGSFAINGFGEAARAYFGKDVHQLTLPECALLAGLIQSPSRLNPYRHPLRATERRNLVLDAMVETGEISKEQGDAAKASPLTLAPGSFDAGEAPWFVDLVREQLTARLGDSDYNQQGLRIYTSLDPQLQQAATEIVAEGMKNVDKLVEARHERRVKAGDNTPIVYPQVALIALDPHTGEVLALVGGRNYGDSQFNHAVSHRPTGSIFKPFVYAAAFNTSLAGSELTSLEGATGIFTPVTMLNDEQITFTFAGGQSYSPRDFERNDYRGLVTARTALQWSLNNPTVELASMVGYNNVAALARDAGIKSARGTPAMAIGAYDATPLEMAGAYTVFANNGVKIEPWMLASVRSPTGDPISDYTPETKPILDPRAAYLTTSLMENVLNAGTGGVVRRLGFTAPAAGKTGTENDSWFAGYTSNLICIVWIGNDDYSDLKIQGADAAGPIWTEFMKRAVALPQYSDTRPFAAPSGVVDVRLDKATNLLSDASCTDDYYAAFLDGTQPTDTCDHANGDQRSLFQKIFGLGEKPANSNALPTLPGVQPPAAAPRSSAPGSGTGSPASPAGSGPQAQNQQQQPAAQPQKKPGFFSRVFGGKKNKTDPDDLPPPPPPPSTQ